MLDEAQQDYAKVYIKEANVIIVFFFPNNVFLINYFQALEIDESFTRAKEGMQKVQKLQKQAKKRDYYKILGVKKNANKREIVKAYR